MEGHFPTYDRDAEGKAPVLIPGLDLLNHNPKSHVAWIWNATACTIQTDEALYGGSEVPNNYGPKSNEERKSYFSGLQQMGMIDDHLFLVIMGYGFSLPKNPADHFTLGFSSAIAAYVDTVRQRRWLQSQAPVPGISDESRQETTEETSIHCVSVRDRSPEFSPNFLEDFSIAIENPRECRKNERMLQSGYDLFGPSLSRNTLHVLSAIFMILGRGYTAIRKHDCGMIESPNNSRQVDAARYRKTQLHILDLVLLALSKKLSSLLEKKFEDSKECKIVRLEDILTHSPKKLQMDFRSVLNAGVKTRDPAKIRQRGGTDFAFTVWLCGLLIYNRQDMGQLEPLDPSNSFNEQCSHWLKFLQESYPEEESEILTAEVYSATVLEDDRAAWFDPVRNSTGGVGSTADSTSTINSYLEAIQTCAKRHPQSLYNDVEVSPKRLAWCYNIIRNEGVWIPNVRDKEGDDEWMLYLDH